MVYKSLNDLIPEYLPYESLKGKETRYSFRNSVNKLRVPILQTITIYIENGFTYSAASLWDTLPSNRGETKSLNQFKSLVNLNFMKLGTLHS